MDWGRCSLGGIDGERGNRPAREGSRMGLGGHGVEA
jgi:hypothetical protein